MRLDPSDVPALHAFARQIANELGAPWRYDERDSRHEGDLCGRAVLKTGLTEYGVNVRIDYRKKDRVELGGRLPTRDRDGNTHWTWSEHTDGKFPKITVALSRGARGAAHDIKTRLLPAYSPAYAKARSHVDARNEELESLKRAAAMFEPYAQLGRGREYSGASDGRFYLRNNRGSVHYLPYCGEAEMRVRVTAETAVEIMRLVENDKPVDV